MVLMMGLPLETLKNWQRGSLQCGDDDESSCLTNKKRSCSPLHEPFSFCFCMRQFAFVLLCRSGPGLVSSFHSSFRIYFAQSTTERAGARSLILLSVQHITAPSQSVLRKVSMTARIGICERCTRMRREQQRRT